MDEKKRPQGFTHIVPPRKEATMKIATPLTPIVPPRPKEPANKAIAAHEAIRRQSDHEIKVGRDFEAMQGYVKGREVVDRELAGGVIVCARALGETENLPPWMRELEKSMPPPMPRKNTQKVTPVHANARKGASRATIAAWLAAATAAFELAKELAPLFKTLFGAPQ